MKLIGQLSIDNLLGTDWEDQFDIHQLREIYEGIRSHVDVMIYANPQYHHQIMSNLKFVMTTKSELINDALKIANENELSHKEKIQKISKLMFPDKDIQE